MKYILNDEKMFLDSAEGTTIVIEFTSGSYFGFSSLASAIVEKLAHGVDTEDICNAVSSLPGCPDSFRSDFDVFTAELLDKEILKECPDAAPEATAEIGQDALADGFALNCFANSELQDLIMADPVHDVDPNAGWPFMK